MVFVGNTTWFRSQECVFMRSGDELMLCLFCSSCCILFVQLNSVFSFQYDFFSWNGSIM